MRSNHPSAIPTWKIEISSPISSTTIRAESVPAVNDEWEGLLRRLGDALNDVVHFRQENLELQQLLPAPRGFGPSGNV